MVPETQPKAFVLHYLPDLHRRGDDERVSSFL